MNEQKIGYLKILLTVFIGNAVGPLVRWVNQPSLVITFYTQLFAFVACMAYIICSKQTKKFPRRNKMAPLILVGAISTINFIFTFLAFQNTSIANVVLIQSLAPIAIILLSPLIVKEAYDRKIFYLTPIALIGAIMIINPSNVSLMNRDFLGMFYAFISALSYAFLILLSKKFLSDNLPIFLVLFQSIVGSVVLFPYVLLNRSVIDLNTYGLLILQGVLLYALNPLLYYQGLKVIKVQHTSLFIYLGPAVAILYGFLFFDEIPNLLSIIGGMLILSSTFYVTMNSLKKNTSLKNEKFE